MMNNLLKEMRATRTWCFFTCVLLSALLVACVQKPSSLQEPYLARTTVTGAFTQEATTQAGKEIALSLNVNRSLVNAADFNVTDRGNISSSGKDFVFRWNNDSITLSVYAQINGTIYDASPYVQSDTWHEGRFLKYGFNVTIPNNAQGTFIANNLEYIGIRVVGNLSNLERVTDGFNYHLLRVNEQGIPQDYVVFLNFSDLIAKTSNLPRQFIVAQNEARFIVDVRSVNFVRGQTIDLDPTIDFDQQSGGAAFVASAGVDNCFTYNPGFVNQTANLSQVAWHFYEYDTTVTNITAYLYETNSSHLPNISTRVAIGTWNASDGNAVYNWRNFTMLLPLQVINRSKEYAVCMNPNTTGGFGAYALDGNAPLTIASRDVFNLSGVFKFMSAVHFETYISGTRNAFYLGGTGQVYACTDELAQRFVPTSTGPLTNISTQAYPFSIVAGSSGINYTIWNDVNDQPGSIIANGSLGVAADDGSWVQAYLDRPLVTSAPNQPTLIAGTTYWAVMGVTNCSGGGLALEVDANSVYDPGMLHKRLNGAGAWLNYTMEGQVYITQLPNASSGGGSTSFNSTNIYLAPNGQIYLAPNGGLYIQ